MLLVEKTLAILAALVHQTWRYPLVGLLLMIAVSVVIAWRASAPSRSHRWVVRKGICPCCGSALFGTTVAYQRLPGLDLVYPESPYLCLACDHAKVTALQQQYHLETTDD
jgi:hypothetical protein